MKFITLLFLCLGSSYGNIPVCNEKARLPYSDWSMFLNQSCYFTILNATLSSNTLEWALFRHDLVFNLTNARETCIAFDAHLPVINSDYENRFVASYQANQFVDEYGERIVYRIALGMQRTVDGDFEWDDGTSVTYTPTHGWERKNDHDCVALRRDPDEPAWMNYPCHGINVGRLGVVCKRVINPDCQYALVPSGPCLWDHVDKTCYRNARVQVLAPELKGGKACPNDEVKQECVCTEQIEYAKQADDPMANGCDKGDCKIQRHTEEHTGSGVDTIAINKYVAILISLGFRKYLFDL